MFGRAMMAAGWHVAADHLADRLGPFPANIAFMGVRHKRQPIGTCLPARLHTGGAVACRHSRLTISIGAAVDGVLANPMDGGVVRAPPNRIAVLCPSRRDHARGTRAEPGVRCRVPAPCRRPGRDARGNAPSAAASTSPPAPRVSCVYFSLFGSGFAGLGQAKMGCTNASN